MRLDQVKNGRQAPIYAVSRDAHEAETQSFKCSLAFEVHRLSTFVCAAIDLNGQHLLQATEVHNELSDRVLAPKLLSVERSVP
jgi:hypothetical protein